MVDENVQIVVDDTEVDATIAKIEGALDKKGEVEQTKLDADEAKKSGDEVLSQGPEIKGTSLLVRRTVAQLPQVRETYHLLSLIRTILRITPTIGILLAAWMAGRSFVDWLQERAREAEEYRKLIIAYQGLTSKAQVEAWLAEDKKRTDEVYRSAVPL